MLVTWQKYIRKFIFDPKMSINCFIKTVKDDCMYEISKNQFYWLKLNG